MLTPLKKWTLPFFSLNKSERMGILILGILVIALLVVNVLMTIWVKSPQPASGEAAFRTEIADFFQTQTEIGDSIRIQELQNSGRLDMEIALQKIKPKPFDPNKLPEELWLEMGFSAKQVAAIKKYEAKGGKFYQKEDVKKLYCISDAEYQLIEPYIEIKSPYKTKPARKKAPPKEIGKPALTNTDINTADAQEIETNLQLSSWLAKRVVKYRELLGGYHHPGQLLEVYGMKSSYYENIRNHVVVDTTRTTKIDINQVDFKELLRHPYFEYETTKTIINARKKAGGFGSLDDLRQHCVLSDSVFQKISPYIQVTPKQ